MIKISSIKLEFLEGERPMWRVIQPVMFSDGLSSFSIPEGFESDLASVPRALWPMFPPYGNHLRAAIVHDWLYSNKAIARVRADALFLAAMESYGTARCQRWCMYLAVRAFGWAAWRASRVRPAPERGSP